MWKWVPLLMVAVLLSGACSKREQAGEAAAKASPGGAASEPQSTSPAHSEAQSETRPGEIVPSREITLQKQTAPASPPAPASEPAARLRPLPGASHLPEDFRIGPLEDLLARGGTEQRILRASERFLNGLAAGKLVEEAVAAEHREELGRSLQYYLEQDLVPRRYRLGAIYYEQDSSAHDSEAPSDSPPAADTAWMNVRLFGSPGVAEGELYLSASSGRWFVSDIQAGFPLLGEPYERGADKFIPSVYGWRLQ